ncbi:hypothetical protein G6L29_21900 [Agrobacterium rhizogenes]|nr:hypothetical protein [Rhizobium rhizogenes]
MTVDAERSCCLISHAFRLNRITMLLPQQKLFLYMHVSKEAVLSSPIEGTQSAFSELLRFETKAQTASATATA